MAKTDDNTTTGEAVGERVIALSRDELRALFFHKKTEQQAVPMSWNGVDFEWRQPTVQMVQDARDDDTDKNFIIKLIIDFSYLPGTNERLFESGDYEMLMAQPFNRDWQKAVGVIGEAVGLGVEAKAKN